MARTEWYGWNITGKVFNQSRSHWKCHFYINPASTLTPLAFLYVLIIYLWLLATKLIFNSTELKCTQSIKLYRFVHTILSLPFVQYHFVCIPFCPYHFVRYHFVQYIYIYLSDTSPAPEKPGTYLKTPFRRRRSIYTHFSGTGEVLI